MMRRQLVVSGRYATVVALTLVVLLLPTPEGLSLVGKRALAALVFAGGVFAMQPVSLPFASLMVSVALVVLGVADSSQAFEVLSRPIIILILGSLFIAEALRKHGVTRRLALFSVVSSGGDVGKILLGMMAIAALLSMWMENTATTAVLIPVALTIANQIPDRERAREVTVLLVLGIAYSASLGGMVTVTGSASNAVASGFLSEIQPWGFLDWVKYGLPPFVLIFPLTWWALRRLVPVSTERMDISLAREELGNLGSARSAEWEVIAVLNVTALLWVIGSYLEPYLGFPATALSPAGRKLQARKGSPRRSPCEVRGDGLAHRVDLPHHKGCALPVRLDVSGLHVRASHERDEQHDGGRRVRPNPNQPDPWRPIVQRCPAGASPYPRHDVRVRPPFGLGADGADLRDGDRGKR